MRLRQAFLVMIVVSLIGACSHDDDSSESSSTSTTDVAITTLADSATGTQSDPGASSSTTTTTTLAMELSFPKYNIISREASDNGDIVVVLLDTSSYESLSDIDIHNIMSDLVEQYAPVYEAYLVETQAAADALFVEDPTDEEKTALDNGYVAKLEQGFRIVYEGPLSNYGVAILGS